MRILFLNHNLIWRGTFFRCLGFARTLVRRGHEVEVWTVARERDLRGTWCEIDGVRVWQTPRWMLPGKHDGGYAPLDILTRLMRACIEEWDVIHAFDHRPNVLLPWLWLKTQAWSTRNVDLPLFVSDWCDWWTCGGITTSRRRYPWIDHLEQRIEEGSKKISDGVTVISHVLQERALHLGIEQERCLLLPSGVEVERFPVKDRQECREQLGLPQDALLLGFAGFSLWDLRLLAEAFEAIKQKHKPAKLLVIGGGVEAQAMDIFQQRFRVNDEVFLPGSVTFEDLPIFLGACDLHILPMEENLANRARIPNKLFDYMASARPIVASNVGDTAQIIHEHGIGLTGECNARGLAQAVDSLLSTPNRMGQMGEAARAIAEEEYAFSSLSRKLEEFYHFLIDD